MILFRLKSPDISKAMILVGFDPKKRGENRKKIEKRLKTGNIYEERTDGV